MQHFLACDSAAVPFTRAGEFLLIPRDAGLGPQRVEKESWSGRSALVKTPGDT